jgi:hypothetical protein
MSIPKIKLLIEFKKHNDEFSINLVLLQVWRKLMTGFQSEHKNVEYYY